MFYWYRSDKRLDNTLPKFQLFYFPFPHSADCEMNVYWWVHAWKIFINSGIHLFYIVKLFSVLVFFFNKMGKCRLQILGNCFSSSKSVSDKCVCKKKDYNSPLFQHRCTKPKLWSPNKQLHAKAAIKSGYWTLTTAENWPCHCLASWAKWQRSDPNTQHKQHP